VLHRKSRLAQIARFVFGDELIHSSLPSDGIRSFILETNGDDRLADVRSQHVRHPRLPPKYVRRAGARAKAGLFLPRPIGSTIWTVQGKPSTPLM
jgi:hypothetical protein